MPHFFIDSKNVKDGKIIICDKENFNHIVKSLRSKIGERLLLIDENQIQYETKIENIDSNYVEVEIIDSYKSTRKLDFKLYLAQTPLRSDAQSIIIEKATELGVAGVYPLLTDNCALKKTVISNKIEKWQKIMYEASKQCERAEVPKMSKEITLEDLMRENFDRIFAFCERRTDLSLHKLISQSPINSGEKICVIVGPEGGFSQKEFDFFERNGIPMVTLGELILKAETAVIVGLGNIIYEYSNYK